MPKVKQPSRKTKSAWRKNIDIDSIEASLEKQRVAERLGDDVIHKDTIATSIFVEDRRGDQTTNVVASGKVRPRKGLKSLEVLNNHSGAMGLTSRARKSAIAAGKIKSKEPITSTRSAVDAGLTPEQRAIRAGMSKKDIEKLRRIAGRDVKGAFGVIVEEGGPVKRGVEAVIAPGTYDVWNGESAQDHTSSAIAKGDIQLPASYMHAIKKGKSRALSIPKPGQSYNPSAEDHEELLNKAIAIAQKEEDAKQKELEWKKNWDNGAKQARGNGTDAVEDLVGLKVDQGDSDEADEDGSESDTSDVKIGEKTKVKETKRKTKQQRVKARQLKEEQRQRFVLKAAKKSQVELQSLKSLKKQLSIIEREKSEAAEKRRLAKRQGLERRVGVYKMPKESEEVQLGEDLAEGLRLLKPEGNLLKDRVHSFYKSGIVEPKKRDIIGKKKGSSMRGRKEYESHAYKRFS